MPDRKIFEKHYYSFEDLNDDVCDDNEEGPGEIEEEPDLHGFDTGGAGQAGGDGEVDGGQHHHAGDVDAVDHVKLRLYQSCRIMRYIIRTLFSQTMKLVAWLMMFMRKVGK